MSESPVNAAFDGIGEGRRLEREAARALRRRIESLGAEGADLAGRDPEDLFGAFQELPARGRAALVAAIESDEWWRLRGYCLGDWHVRLVHGLRSPAFRRMSGRVGRLLAPAIQVGPSHALYALRQAVLAGISKWAARPTLDALLSGVGVPPWRLSICYARPLEQPVPFRGFWHDPGRNFTVGSMLGIDFISAPDGCWFVEANLDAGFEIDRTILYERDPFVGNLLAAVRHGGYRQLVLMAGNSSVDEVMARQYEEGARALGVRLRIVEDAFRPSRYEHSAGIPAIEEGDTLVVRANYYRTNLDYLFQHKAATNRALERYKEKTGDPDLCLPRTRLDPTAARYGREDAFPNVVFKFPERDHGKGVFFLKATSADHARSLATDAVARARHPDLISRLYAATDDHAVLFQEYIPSHLLEGRRLYKVRAHVLLAPTGVRYLSSHRVVSTVPVPETLPVGYVHDPSPFVVNFHTGARYHLIPPEEEERIARASLAVARGLSSAAVQSYRTSPASADAVSAETA